MNRKERPILQRILLTVSVFALIGSAGYIYFSGLTLAAGVVIGLALAGIATPVVSGGGGIVELVAGVFEALIDGLMGVVDAIAGLFNF